MPERGLVKGMSFGHTRARVIGLIERGVIARETLEIELSAEALDLIDEKVEPSLWYAVDAVSQLTDLLQMLEGDGRNEYLRELGRAALAPMLERESIRAFIEGSVAKPGMEGRNLVQLAGLVYSFGEWSFEGEDLSAFTVSVDDASMMPSRAAETIAGFMQALVAYCTDHEIDVVTSRPEPGRVVFNATRVEAR